MATHALQSAPAKLTRTLEVVGRRADGYHLLRSEMVALDMLDEVWIDESGTELSVVDEIAWSGAPTQRPVLEVPSDRGNLVVRALELVEQQAAIRLVKHIPPGAGLGGGSSDAAAVLRHFGMLDLEVACLLGADVPFCLFGGRALVSGVGEQLEALPDEALCFVVVTPGLSVSTKAVYDAFDELGAVEEGAANHLEAAALAVEPRLATVKALISGVVGRAVTLAGSGSSYFLECSATDQGRLVTELGAAFSEKALPVLISACNARARGADR